MRWKTMIALGLVAGAAVALGLFWPWGRRDNVLRLPGVVEIQEVRLGPRVSGRVAKVHVQEGDHVEKGDLLVQLDVPELKAQHQQALARLREAEAQWEKADRGPRPQEKDAAKAAWEAAKARHDRLATGYRDEEKRQAENELKAAEVDASLTRDELQRARRLLDTAGGSRSDYETARANFERATRRQAAAQAKAEADQAYSNWNLLEAGTREEDKAVAKAHLDEARARARELEINLAEADIHAPEPAVVEVVAVRVGDLVGANQPVIRVLRTRDLWVKVYVPETELGRVRLHQKVQLIADCYPDRPLEGEVLHIAAESEFTPRNVQSVDERKHQVFGVRVRIDDPQGVFKSGMAAEVLIPLQD